MNAANAPRSALEVGAAAAGFIDDMLKAGLISDETFPCFAPPLRALVAEWHEARARVVHFDVGANYAKLWPGAQIPACDQDGDGERDHYTTDRAAVTCARCLETL